VQLGIDIDDQAFDDLPRLQQCKKIRSAWDSKFKNWVDKSRRTNSYLRGSHFSEAFIRKGVDRDDYLPEDRRADGDTKTYPSIPYALSIIDRMVQYIRHDEGEILVTAEGKYAYPMIDDSLLQLGLQLAEDTDSEITEAELVAKMLTARLDLFSHRGSVDSILQEIAYIAASQRLAFVCIDWIDDETSEEPVHTKLIPIGKYWFDPDASTVHQCRFLGYESEMDKDAARRKYGTDVVAEGSTVKLYHHYTRDYTVAESEPEVIDGVGSDGVFYKYPAAWRYTVTTNNAVLYDGPIETPGYRPPVCIFTWRSLPHSLIGVSVLDSTETINNNIDRTIQYIMQAAYRGLPKTAVDTATADPNSLDNNDVGGFLKYDSSKGAGLAYNYIPGSPVPDSLYTLLDTLKGLGAEMSGADGVQMEDASKFKLSGDAIEGLAADREGIAARIRDAWYLFLRDYYQLVIRFIMKYEQDDVSLSMETPQGAVAFETSMKAYQFDDSEFEQRFDVEVFAPKNMPKNPVRRAQYLLQLMGTVAELSNSDPALARMYIDMADLPNKQAMLSYIEAKIQAQAEAQEVAPQVDDKESQLVLERRASDIAKSVGDSLEALAKNIGKDDPTLALQIIASIPDEANKAYNTVIQGGTWTEPQTEQIATEMM
jgi:hypothetical protein